MGHHRGRGMSYQVTAPLVLVPDGTGRLHHRYKGQIITSLPATAAKHLLDLGMIEQVSAPQLVQEQADEPTAEPASEAAPAAELKRPAQTAPKDTWVDFLAAQGHDRAELEALAKPDLIALAS